MDAATEKAAMTLEQFHSLPEYKILTPAMQVFFDRCVETNDTIQAARVAYPKHARDLKYLNVLVYKLAASPRMRAAKATFYGLSERDKFLADLETDIKRAKSSDKAALQLVRAKVLGLVEGDITLAAAPATEAASQWHVGQRVQQRDRDGVVHHGIILALDANGQPSEIEEVRA